MELDVGDKICGKIWQRKPAADDGLLLKVRHSLFGSCSGPYRSIRFLKVCFHSSGDRFLVGDHLGYIFLFDLSRNRFALVQRTSEPCTAIACGLHNKTEFLVGLGDYSVKCFDTDTGKQIAVMNGHKSAIHNISVDMSGQYAVTTSSETTNLWNLITFKKMHKLNIKEDVGLLQTFFLPNSNTILTCFRDDTVFGWDLESLRCKFQLLVPSNVCPQYCAFAASPDSHYLVAGGRSRFLHLWSLETMKLIKVIEMPVKVMCIRQLEFLNVRHGIKELILAVLSQNGILQFINIDTCKMLFEIDKSESKIIYMAFGPSCHHAVTIMEDGKLHIYSMNSLTAALQKSPCPVMKLVNSKLSELMLTESSLRGTEFLKRSSGTETEQCLKQGENNKENLNLQGLNKEKFLTILKSYGEYPAKYRMFIWQKILQLPDNFSVYAGLIDKGIHPSYAKLYEVYPIKSHKLLRILQRILSALAHWSPIFGETQFLPSFCFPFVRLYQNNHLACFEVVATVLVNWCQHWFEYFPNPPVNILGMIENLLAHHDQQLLHHFVKHGLTSQIYAWSLLETVFSEVLTKDEWLILWDNVLSNNPAFLITSVVAYNICARSSLLKCTDMEDFKFFFHHRNALSIKHVVIKTYKLMEDSSNSVHPQTQLDEFVPLPKESYPVFNKYPKFIVDYQIQERERIHQEEQDYLRLKHIALDAKKMAVHEPREEQFYRQQKHLLEAEDEKEESSGGVKIGRTKKMYKHDQEATNCM